MPLSHVHSYSIFAQHQIICSNPIVRGSHFHTIWREVRWISDKKQTSLIPTWTRNTRGIAGERIPANHLITHLDLPWSKKQFGWHSSPLSTKVANHLLRETENTVQIACHRPQMLNRLPASKLRLETLEDKVGKRCRCTELLFTSVKNNYLIYIPVGLDDSFSLKLLLQQKKETLAHMKGGMSLFFLKSCKMKWGLLEWGVWVEFWRREILRKQFWTCVF